MTFEFFLIIYFCWNWFCVFSILHKSIVEYDEGQSISVFEIIWTQSTNFLCVHREKEEEEEKVENFSSHINGMCLSIPHTYTLFTSVIDWDFISVSSTTRVSFSYRYSEIYIKFNMSVIVCLNYRRTEIYMYNYALIIKL